MDLSKAIRHLGTVLTHKYWVGVYCFKAGLYWRGLTHDLSKFSPTEFSESVKYYTGTVSPIDTAKKANGYSLAWQHHKGRNDHHHVYWCDNFDEGTTAIKMPYDCAVEMICDYLGAARAYLGDEFTYAEEWKWWCSKMGGVNMHDRTKDLVSTALYYMAFANNDNYIVGLANDLELRKSYENDSMLGFLHCASIRGERTLRL